MLDQGVHVNGNGVEVNGNGKTLPTEKEYNFRINVHRLSPDMRALYDTMVFYKFEYNRAKHEFEMALYNAG